MFLVSGILVQGYAFPWKNNGKKTAFRGICRHDCTARAKLIIADPTPGFEVLRGLVEWPTLSYDGIVITIEITWNFLIYSCSRIMMLINFARSPKISLAQHFLPDQTYHAVFPKRHAFRASRAFLSSLESSLASRVNQRKWLWRRLPS